MKKIILVFTFILLKGIISAQEFTAGVSQNPVSVGEEFQVSFTLNTGGRNFQAPSFNDFYVVSGPSQSSSMQFVNGNVSQSFIISYILQGKSEGSFKIGPATIEAGGKKIQSSPITIKVVKGSSQAQGQGQRGGSQGGGNTASAPSQDMGNNLFLRVSVSKSSAYQGEEITATYKLYFKVNVVNLSQPLAPAFGGFWSQDEQAKPLSPVIETLDGVSYKVLELKKVDLYPQHSGTLEIPPMEIEVVVRQQAKRRSSSNDIFDQLFNDPFFGGGAQDVGYKIKGNAVKVSIKDLPGLKPASFSGAVGKFSMESSMDKPETKANEPVTLKVKISGKGNIKLLDSPKLSFPPDIEAYDPKTADNITVNNGISGTRTFEYLLIPRHSGEYKIAPFTFTYFDLDKKEYVNLSSPEFKLKVAKGNGSGPESSSNAITGVSKEDIQLLGKDIRYIKTTRTELKLQGSTFFGSSTFYSLLLSPVLLFIAFLAYYRKNRELSSNITLMKSRKANKMALKRLSSARLFLQQNKKSEFYDEISKALWGYIGDRLGIPMAQLSKETATNELQKRNIQPDLIHKFILTLDNSEFARFGPGGASEMQTMYDNTVELISKIEEEIK